MEDFEKEFRRFKEDVIERLARIETKLENGKKPSYSSALVEVIRVLVAALLAVVGIKVVSG